MTPVYGSIEKMGQEWSGEGGVKVIFERQEDWCGAMGVLGLEPLMIFGAHGLRN